MQPGPWPTKAPADRLDYAVDFSADLLPGETLAAVSGWASVPPGLTVDGTTVIGSQGLAWLVGGTPNTGYAVDLVGVTGQGRTIGATVSLFVGPVGLDWGF